MMKSAVEIFAELGARLADFGCDARSRLAVSEAVAANGWFSEEDICRAVEAFRSDMLREDLLREWLSSYELPTAAPCRVAVIMAGNIPLVGFFDLMCVVASGHTAVVKPSGKDRVLVEYVVTLLREIEPSVRIELSDEAFPEADAVIATGNDNAKRSFKTAYSGCPQLLRGNRHSVAVLSGSETEQQIAGLLSDMFDYSGLGCRSVSMVFVPRGYDLRLPARKMNPKYENNYRQTRAMLTMNGVGFVDTGSTLLVAGEEFPSAVSCITVCEYDEISEVESWLREHDGELQCVVSESVVHSRVAGFGRAQHPRLQDYPDAVDVMSFLAVL